MGLKNLREALGAFRYDRDAEEKAKWVERWANVFAAFAEPDEPEPCAHEWGEWETLKNNFDLEYRVCSCGGEQHRKKPAPEFKQGQWVVIKDQVKAYGVMLILGESRQLGGAWRMQNPNLPGQFQHQLPKNIRLATDEEKFQRGAKVRLTAKDGSSEVVARLSNNSLGDGSRHFIRIFGQDNHGTSSDEYDIELLDPAK